MLMMTMRRTKMNIKIMPMAIQIIQMIYVMVMMTLRNIIFTKHQYILTHILRRLFRQTGIFKTEHLRNLRNVLLMI